MGSKHQVEHSDGTVVNAPKKKCLPFNRSSLQRVVGDLTLLDEMHAPLILHNLKQRFEKQSKIYTNIGTSTLFFVSLRIASVLFRSFQLVSLVSLASARSAPPQLPNNATRKS